MAKLKQGIFGPVSGKIGPVVGGSWKGIPLGCSAPEKKENSNLVETTIFASSMHDC